MYSQLELVQALSLQIHKNYDQYRSRVCSVHCTTIIRVRVNSKELGWMYIGMKKQMLATILSF